MNLQQCTLTWGDQILLPCAPALRIVENGVVVPKAQPGAYDFDTQWGVFDASGARVEAAAYRRGPGLNYVGQGPYLTVAADQIVRSEQPLVIYGGVGHSHFGHFMVSTLARLWIAGSSSAPPGTKYLFHLDQSPAEWFSVPFVADSLAGLGIFLDDVIRVEAPTRYDTLLAPEPSFEETRSFHPCFRETALRIGDALTADSGITPGSAVYLSKERLPGGVKRFENEAELVGCLRAEGVTIVYPEMLTLAQQVDLFRKASIVVGSLSSAFHTTILSSEPVRLVGLCHDSNVFSTFKMIDRLTGNPALYLHQAATATGQTDPHFMSTFRLADPRSAAQDLLRVIEGVAAF